MNSNPNVHKLPFQTKIVFGFILILTLALVSKWMYFSLVVNAKAPVVDAKLSGIKGQVTAICLKEESKSIKVASEATEEDQEWMNFKAPEYCKCVSTHMITMWSDLDKVQQIVSIKNEELPHFIVTQLKDEHTKPVIDLCLAKAQKMPGRKVTASANIKPKVE